MRLTNIRWTLVSTLAAFSLSALPAIADQGEGGRADHHRDPAALIKHFDKNGDGKLELTELPDHMKQRLAAADTNQDGVLSVEELTAHHEAKKAERQAAMDTDGDGKISDAERAAFREKMEQEHFARMDKNGDGQLSEAEVGRFWSKISLADTDKSGTVSYAEMQQAIAAGTLKAPGHGGHCAGKTNGTTTS